MRLNTYLALTLTAASLWQAAAAAPATLDREFSARVIHVDDGDTVVALKPDQTRVTIRLANIDAPETSHGRCKPGQPWSAHATSALKQMVHGHTIRFTCSTLDRYDRSVCDLHLLGGRTTANRELVRMGLAWANRSHPSYLRDAEVAVAEAQARQLRAGIWSDANAVAPWQWRKIAWMQSGCKASEP